MFKVACDFVVSDQRVATDRQTHQSPFFYNHEGEHIYSEKITVPGFEVYIYTFFFIKIKPKILRSVRLYKQCAYRRSGANSRYLGPKHEGLNAFYPDMSSDPMSVLLHRIVPA